MPTFVDAETVRAAERGSIVTIGNFDGVHRGHLRLVDGAVVQAEALGLPAIALTFEPHPATFFRGRNPADFRIQTPAERETELLRAGVAHVATIAFDEALAGLSPQAFVENVLCGELQARGVHIGHDFTFGRGRAGNVDLLRALGDAFGFSVTEHAQLDVGDGAASSTRLREALQAGDLHAFTEIAGRPYAIGDAISSGAGRGRTIGIPTLNQYPTDRLLPPRGVYATRIAIDDAEPRIAISNLGVRPTFAGDPRVSLETHVLDGAPVVNGVMAEVTFVRFLRPEQRFESADALVAQIGRDIEAAREALAD